MFEKLYKILFSNDISLVVLILPLCYTKRIDFLKYVSMLGVLAIVYIVGLIVAQYWGGEHGGSRGRVKTRPDDWLDIMTVVPAICFGYQVRDKTQ